jgi:hypothetical protein
VYYVDLKLDDATALTTLELDEMFAKRAVASTSGASAFPSRCLNGEWKSD